MGGAMALKPLAVMKISNPAIRFALATVALTVCNPVAAGDSQLLAHESSPTGNPVILGGIELCRSTYEAIRALGPKDESGALDADSIFIIRRILGNTTYRFPFPSDLPIVVAGHPPSSIAVSDHNGRLSNMAVNWRGDEKMSSEVWKGLDTAITDLMGPPFGEDPNNKDWKRDGLQAAIYRAPDEGVVGIALICPSLLESTEFLLDLNRIKEGNGMKLLTADLSSLESNRMSPLEFRSCLIDAVRVFGEPISGPCYEGPNLQKATFTGNSGILFGPNTLLSLWYIDGELARYLIGSNRITNPSENSKKVFDHLINLQTESLGPPTTILEEPGVIERSAMWSPNDRLEVEVGIKTELGNTLGYLYASDPTQHRRITGEKLIGPEKGDTWCEQIGFEGIEN